MVQGSMVLVKGLHVGTLFPLDACTIECNSSISEGKIPKEALALESKSPLQKTMVWHERLGNGLEKKILSMD